MDTKEYESFAHGVARREQAARAARLARIDERATAIYAGWAARGCVNRTWEEAYDEALLGERARDGAVKEIQ